MNTANKLSGVALAAAAALLITGCNSGYESSATTAEAMVKCSGINSCKGTSACQTQQMPVKDKIAVKVRDG